MGAVAAVVTAVSAIAGAGAAYIQGQQAADDRRDAKKQLELQAQRDAEIFEEESKKLTSKQRALYARAGVRVDEGSPLAVIEKSQQDAEEERLAILQGYGYRSDALGTEATRLERTGTARAGGTLLSGIANYASSPYAKNPFA